MGVAGVSVAEPVMKRSVPWRMKTGRLSGAVWWSVVVAMLGGRAAGFQAVPDSSIPARAQEPAGTARATQELPPQLRLGQRVDAIRQHAAAVTTLVLVRDAASYREAIAAWRPTARFPVLIDDGTSVGRDQIALFARTFKPTKVVYWGGEAEGAYEAAGFARAEPGELAACVARAWGLEKENATDEALLAHWKGAGYAPPGIVVVGFDDPAWTGGLALAAGRGQPLVFVKARQGVDATIGKDEAGALVQAIEAGAASTGLSWNGLGDEIDAVTLCLNTPNRYAGDKEFLAMTDRVGRLGAGEVPGQRWAWAGQVFGTPSRSAYQAMCSLFLMPEAAFLFDGYPAGEPWSHFDATRAGEPLKQRGFVPEVMDLPRGSAHDWRVRGARAVEAGLVFVNTKGNDDFFDLQPGQCKPGDVPILGRPAAATIVHSWSATNAGNRDRLGGRFLERGVFAYAGSVHEPFLGAFVPTPQLTARLAAGVPFGVAVRNDPSKWWKIAVLGDPLYTLGPPARRVEAGVALEGARDILTGLRERLVAKEFGKAFEALSLAGRDAEVARLAEAILGSKDQTLDPAGARQSVMPLMRAGLNHLVWKAYARMSAADQQDPMLRDALWLSVYPLLDGRPEDALLDVLTRNVRGYQGWRDALAVGRCINARDGMDKAVAAVGGMGRGLSQAEREQLERGMKEPVERWGR